MAVWMRCVFSLSTMQSRMNGRRDQHFDGRAAALAVRARNEALRDDRPQHRRQLEADLLLLVRREDGDDAVDGLGRVQRVERREHEVARLGREQGGFDRLEVAHLADQDHVGVLAQGGAHGVGERPRVGRHLALVDDRLVVLVQELDRVLDGHDVHAPRAVDVVHHAGQRRALAAARRAGDQDEAAFLVGDLRDDRRQAQFLDGADLHRDDAEHEPDGVRAAGTRCSGSARGPRTL